MIAAAQCLTSGQPWLYAAGSSMAREKAVTYIQAVDEWLRMQSQKRVTATDFQIRFLLLLARQASARKYKRTWTDAGNLLRFCMCAGLHRNPDLIRKPTSALDKELRRRVWQAVVELELQAAFDRGMVSAPWTLQADCPPPINIHDKDVDQDSEQLPTAVPAEEFTNSSYLSKASESTLLRHGLNTTLNNIRQTLSFNDVKRFSEEIETHLQAIPDWQAEGSDAPRALLMLNLRQYLLVLHDRQIRQAESSTERSFSRMMLIDNATRIIDTHRKLIGKSTRCLTQTHMSVLTTVSRQRLLCPRINLQRPAPGGPFNLPRRHHRRHPSRQCHRPDRRAPCRPSHGGSHPNAHGQSHPVWPRAASALDRPRGAWVLEIPQGSRKAD